METPKNKDVLSQLGTLLEATEVHRKVFDDMTIRIVDARSETEVNPKTSGKIIDNLETFALDAITAQPTVSSRALEVALQQATDVYLDENIKEIMEENSTLRHSRLEEFIRAIAPHLKPNWEK